MSRKPLVVLCFCFLVSLASGRPSEALELRVSGAEILVEGLSAGQDVVLLWMARVPQGYYQELHSGLEELSDDDQDGAARFAPPEGVPAKSVWVAVDVQSGEVAATGSSERPATLNSFPAGAVVTGADGSPLALALARGRVLAAVVRPGGGLWRAMVADGGSADLDAAPDNTLHLSPVGMTAAGSTTDAPSSSYAPGDVLVAIDVRTLDAFSWTAPAGGAQ